MIIEYVNLQVYDDLFKILNTIDPFKFESLTEETSEEITRKILDLSTTKYIKQLKVSNMIKDFSCYENLLKLKEVIPNTVIVFDFKYNQTESQNPSWYIEISGKTVTCVYKGSELDFEQIDKWGDDNIWSFNDIKQIENSCYAILKMNEFIWYNLVIKERSWIDDWRRPYIDELKKSTETNDDLFIIADLNNLILPFWLNKIEYYSPIFKYFKHIIIRISLYDLRKKKLVDKINNLPKQYHYEVRSYYYKGVKYDFLNLIGLRFENLSIKYIGYPYEIKIKRSKRSNSTPNEQVSKWGITAINKMNRQMIKTDSKYLKELLFTM